jgi:SAM-dependent methyltransferase
MAATMAHPTFAELASRMLSRLGFDAYRDRELADLHEARGALFAVVERVLATLPTPTREEMTGELLEHLGNELTQQRFYDGVSAARADRDMTWEAELQAAWDRSREVGAVHLELGVWSAFPDSRQRQIVEQEGLAEFIRLDFEPQYELDVVADAQQMPFADESIDRIAADSVLEHLAYPHLVIHECHRMLRPGGMVHIATPWVFNLHGYPDDYLRYSPSFYERICAEAGFDVVLTDIDAARGLYYTLHNSAKTAIVDASDPAAAALRTLHLLTIDLLGALVPLDNRFENRARHWFHSVRLLAIKGGVYEPSGREQRPGGFLDRALDLLADPESKAPLQMQKDSLLCATSGTSYPVFDGIPHFTQPEQARRSRTADLSRLFRR